MAFMTDCGMKRCYWVEIKAAGSSEQNIRIINDSHRGNPNKACGSSTGDSVHPLWFYSSTEYVFNVYTIKDAIKVAAPLESEEGIVTPAAEYVVTFSKVSLCF